MALTPGTHIGAYEVLAKLGEGGMGEVYRAKDSKLKREVALKVLPADVANDRERMARFQREAEVLASLNHPNIAHIHGLEDENGTTALVMELVEGEDLAERLKRGAIPLDEALPIAKQIAEALEAAHEQGIIHRDLKPANVKVRPDGTVKVLDFGLAKALDEPKGSSPQQIANSPTITSPAMTMRGVILGTAAYMAPEQAKGKAVDKRADIWAFGCVLFEMLSAQRTFKGDDVTDIITSLMRDQPDWQALPVTTPASIRTLLRRCLEKDPRNRAPHISVARMEIADAMVTTGELMMPPVTARTGGLSPAVVALVAAVCIAVASAGTWMALRPAVAAPQPLIRATWPFPAAGILRQGVQRNLLSIAANGRAIALIANGVKIRSTDALEWTSVPDTVDATSVFTSPDGEWAGYSTRSGLWKVRLSGGPPVALATMKDSATYGVFASAWGDDHRIYYTNRTGLYSVPDDGRSEPQQIVAAGDLDAAIHVLPAGRGLLYGRGLPATSIVLHRFGGEPPVTLVEGVAGKFVAPDLLVFVRGTTLMGVRVDLDAGKVVGEPVALSTEVAAVVSRTPQFDVSRDGILVYVPAGSTNTTESLLAVRGLDGSMTRLTSEVRMYSDPRLSPDGKRLALHVLDDQDDVWVYEMARGAMTRITFDPAEDETPVWSPDGRWLAFGGTVRGGSGRAVFRRNADGGGTEEMLWSSPNHAHVNDWSPDGRSILVEVVDPKRRSDLVLIDVAAKTMAPLIASPFNEASARVSPDGRWVAYYSDESGQPEVFIQSFPTLGNKVQVSIGGGDQPVWSRDGHTIYYRSETEFKSSRVDQVNGKLEVSAPVALFPDTFLRPQVVNHTTFEVFPDGRLLLFQHPPDASVREPVIVGVFNWLDDVRKRVR